MDIVFSYHQDRFNTVHYVGIFGDNGTGKSSIGDVFEALAYRAMNTTDPTVANIFRSLGSVEPGQLTLILDEAEKVDQNPEIMSILKTGYDYRKTVSRINQNTGKPERFFTYCFKMIIGERPPSPILAKGVNDRILGDTVYYGNPQYDIKEVLNPTDTGGEELKILFDEINECKKILFAYRILHFRDPIPNIALRISGRNKELVKPHLQMFSNIKTEEDKQNYGQIENTFAKMLGIKNEKKNSTLEFALMPIIVDLMKESKTRIIKFSDFWLRLISTIRGKLNENKPNEYNTEDYGTIYRNSVTPTLHKLGVKTKHRKSFTELLFDHKKIVKTASQYGLAIQEEMEDFRGEHSERCERSTESLISDDSSLEKKQSDKSTEIANTCNENCLNYDNDDLKDTSVKASEDDKDKPSSVERSQRSQQSPTENEQDTANSSLYRIGKTDTWSCKKCN